jgi:hypothetical protein
MTGVSRAQTTRLIARYVATGQVRIESGRRHRFPNRLNNPPMSLSGACGLEWNFGKLVTHVDRGAQVLDCGLRKVPLCSGVSGKYR